jgi:uncharacterized membrane protein YccC
VGTLAGVGVATLAALLLPQRHLVVIALVGLFDWVAAATVQASYSLFSAAITGAVVFLLAGVDPSPIADAVDRLVATLLGTGLALGVYAAWPSWARGEARAALAELLDAHRAYMDEVLAQLAGTRVRRPGTLDALDRRRRLARGNAEAVVARSLADPVVRRIDERMARGVLAAVRRQVIAAHTLRTRLLAEDGPTMPEVAPLTEALDATLAAASALLRGETVERPASLRPLHDELVERLRRRPLEDGPRTLVATQIDEMVDAAGTLTHRLWASV